MTDTDATVAFLDLARFTTLTDVHGDAAALAVLDQFTDAVDGALQGQARLVKTLGDGVLLTAPTPTDGIAVAVRIVTAFHDHDGLPEIAGGITHGPVAARGGDVLGRTVNLASRLSDAAPASSLWVTDRVARAAADAGHRVEPLGPVELPGVLDPVEAYGLTPCGHDHHATVTDPVCGMRITPGPATPHLDLDDGRHWFCAEQCRARFTPDPQQPDVVP